MAQTGELDEVWMVVSPQNPHKKKVSLLPDLHRLYMVNLAIEDDPKLKARIFTITYKDKFGKVLQEFELKQYEVSY